MKEGDNVFSDGDKVTHIYFLSKGSAGFVLDQYHGCCYIKVNKGDTFGVIDIIGSSQFFIDNSGVR